MKQHIPRADAHCNIERKNALKQTKIPRVSDAKNKALVNDYQLSENKVSESVCHVVATINYPLMSIRYKPEIPME